MPPSPLDSGWFVRTVPRIPKNLLWEITDACNLRCLHCESSAGRRSAGELDHDEALDLADQIVATGWRHVNVTGGEPLLRRDWPDLCRRLADGGCKVALVTNGLRLDAHARRVARDVGVSTIAVSLDGMQPTHDRIRPGPGKRPVSCFDGAVRALREARADGFGTVAITHVNRWNVDELPSMHRLLGEVGARGWQLQLGVPLGRLREIDEPYMLDIEQLPELERRCAGFIAAHRADPELPAIAVMHSIGYYGPHEAEIRGGYGGRRRFFVGCVGGWRALGITSDGQVKPCAMMPRSFAVGDLRRERLATIWDDRERFVHQVQWDADRLEGACADCEYRHLCRAGCTAMAWGLSGSIYNNPFCLQALKRRRKERSR